MIRQSERVMRYTENCLIACETPFFLSSWFWSINLFMVCKLSNILWHLMKNSTILFCNVYTSTKSRRKKVKTTTQISDKLIWLSSHLHVWQFVTKWKFTSAPFHMTSFQLTNFSAKGKNPRFFCKRKKTFVFFPSNKRFFPTWFNCFYLLGLVQ